MTHLSADCLYLIFDIVSRPQHPAEFTFDSYWRREIERVNRPHLTLRSTSDLVSCSLVCKTWCEVAQPILNAHVYINGAEQAAQVTSGAMKQSHMAVVGSLHIRGVTLSQLFEAAALFPNLHTLELGHAILDDLPHDGVGPSVLLLVEAFHVTSGVDMPSETIDALLQSMPSLAIFVGDFGLTTKPRISPAFLTTFQPLSFGYCWEPGDHTGALQEILVSDVALKQWGRMLQSVSLGWMTPDQVKKVYTLCPRLSDLEFCAHPERPLAEFIEILPSTLSGSPVSLHATLHHWILSCPFFQLRVATFIPIAGDDLELIEIEPEAIGGVQMLQSSCKAKGIRFIYTHEEKPQGDDSCVVM